MSLRPLVLLPTYNEKDTLPAVLDLSFRSAAVDVLVIDDGSPDGTAEIARALKSRYGGLDVWERPGKMGLGSAYREGMARALAEGRPAVVEMDADLSHDPRDLPRLLEPVLSGDAALAIGTRLPPEGGCPGWPLSRRLISRAGNAYARLLLGLEARDLTSGFRAYGGEALGRADPAATRSDGFGFQIEMAWRVARSGGRIAEIPIVFVDRRLGASKMDAAIAWEALVGVPLLRLRTGAR